MQRKILIRWTNDFLQLFYPDYCSGCGTLLVRGEDVLCLECLSDLPFTGFATERDNLVEQVFWGRVRIEHAMALCRFDKGNKLQHMLHRLKYKGDRETGRRLGQLLAHELKRSPNYNQLEGLIPVPLHPRREKTRGYNQSHVIAEAMSPILQIPVLNHYLIRQHHSETQTHKGRYERWENVNTLFDLLKPEELCGKHLLLIDDVVTTGATLEACASLLLEIPDIRVSIATLAFA
ncbi:MAG: ComF family protein [Marinilabiliales bacterium]|nr:ComF family protein [Marinilabiliales bacterium]